MCISFSQLVRNIGLAVFAGIVLFADKQYSLTFDFNVITSRWEVCNIWKWCRRRCEAFIGHLWGICEGEGLIGISRWGEQNCSGWRNMEECAKWGRWHAVGERCGRIGHKNGYCLACPYLVVCIGIRRYANSPLPPSPPTPIKYTLYLSLKLTSAAS